MPFRSIKQLPKKQTDDLSARRKRVFRNVFNSVARRGGSESSAFAQAHSVARGGRKKRKSKRR